MFVVHTQLTEKCPGKVSGILYFGCENVWKLGSFKDFSKCPSGFSNRFGETLPKTFL